MDIYRIYTLVLKNNMNVNDFSEPLKLVGEGEYNINALKEFNVTDSYLGLDENQ